MILLWEREVANQVERGERERDEPREGFVTTFPLNKKLKSEAHLDLN